MSKYALLIDTNWCTGCHTCEMACQIEHGYPMDEFGIKLAHIGPWQITEDNWQDAWVPVPTEQCDTCAMRRANGKPPTCVSHCQAQCIEFGAAGAPARRVLGRGI